jgi:hypothetical protein
MSAKLGSAKKAKRLAKLFEKWRRACDKQDAEGMATAKRAIDALVASQAPSQAVCSRLNF